MHCAAIMGDAILASKLQETGANVNALKYDRETPLHVVININHVNIMVVMSMAEQMLIKIVNGGFHSQFNCHWVQS